jgi:hypothetical protein
MLVAMQLGVSSLSKTSDKLMQNRRVVGAQRILEQELEGLMPLTTGCAVEGGEALKLKFFEGMPDHVKLVSTFSLDGAWRGRPQILEIFVASGEKIGFRLLVNEIPYLGPITARQQCSGATDDGRAIFRPPQPNPRSFILADQLAGVVFSYLGPEGGDPKNPDIWQPTWTQRLWPKAIRVEMAPLEPNPARLQPLTVVAPVRIFRWPETKYDDF